MKKLVFLFLALLLPVLIFLFLRSFGKNEFEVPVLFADSIVAPGACQQYAYATPYIIPDSVLEKISWNKNDSLTIVVFQDSLKMNQHDRSIQLKRVFTEFEGELIKVVQMSKGRGMPEEDQGNGVSNLIIEETQFEALRTCVFLLSTPNDAVIIDRKKRIRGQYNLTERDDADRMIMQEMNILLKRY